MRTGHPRLITVLPNAESGIPDLHGDTVGGVCAYSVIDINGFHMFDSVKTVSDHVEISITDCLPS